MATVTERLFDYYLSRLAGSAFYVDRVQRSGSLSLVIGEMTRMARALVDQRVAALGSGDTDTDLVLAGGETLYDYYLAQLAASTLLPDRVQRRGDDFAQAVLELGQEAERLVAARAAELGTGLVGDTIQRGAAGPAGPPGGSGADGADGAPGADGADGADGAAGPGLPVGGTTDQTIRKASATDFDTAWSDIQHTATNELYLPAVAADPAAPAVGRAYLFMKADANRPMLHTRSDTGRAVHIQTSLFDTSVAVIMPSAGVAAPLAIGIAVPSATGSATARTPATTSMFTRAARNTYLSTAVIGALSGLRTTVLQLATGGASGGLGGFQFEMKFGIGDAAAVAGARMFVGLRNTTGAPTNVEPSTITQCIGIGHGAADTTLRIYYGGSAAQAPIDLGVNFPADTRSTDWYELMLYSPVDVATVTVYYQVTRLNTGQVASGTLTGGSTILPSATTLLCMNSYRTNNATALAVALEFGGYYHERDY